MGIFTNDHTFKYDWPTVVTAFWQKYPNPKADHVTAIDTFRRYIDTDGSMVSHRVVATETVLPDYLSSLGVPTVAFALEQTRCNPETKTLTVRSRNITGSSMMSVEEQCTYDEHPNNSQWTRYRQTAFFEAHVPFFKTKVENFAMSSFASRSRQGIEIMETICEALTSTAPEKEKVEATIPIFGAQASLA